MALMKETSLDKVIANISPNIIMQIILMLILLCGLSNAYLEGYLWEPPTLPLYKLTFINHMVDDIPGYDMNKDKLGVTCTTYSYAMQEVKPNPKASFTFYYGEYTIYITSRVGIGQTRLGFDRSEFGLQNKSQI